MKKLCVLYCLAAALLLGACGAAETGPEAGPGKEMNQELREAETEIPTEAVGENEETVPDAEAAAAESEENSENEEEEITGSNVGEETAEEPKDKPIPDEITAEWFDDAVFFGDSITGPLRYYADSEGGLGEAVFCYDASYSVRSAATDAMLLWYCDGEKTPAEILTEGTFGKVFIQLGINDVGVQGVERSIEYWNEFLQKLREAAPDTPIFIQSSLPMCVSAETEKLNNEKLNAYNEALRAFALENGCVFVTISEAFRGEDGGLLPEASKDNYVHIWPSWGKVWGAELMKTENYEYGE